MHVRTINALHSSLRRSCDSAHRLAEAYTPFLRPGLLPSEMGPLLARLEQVWAALERRVARDAPALVRRGILLQHHMRLPLLQSDRRTWGAPAPAPEALRSVHLAAAVRAPGWARAAGCLYVIAGARLGGAIVGRRLKRELWQAGATGLSFWLSGSHQARPAFARLMRQLAAARPSSIETHDIIAAAQASFASYSAYMGGKHDDAQP